MDVIPLDDETMYCSISTFSGGGIGDAGVEYGANVPVISACELVPDRAGLIRNNYPSTRIFQGDIWMLKDQIIQHSNELLEGKSPWLFVMSPPCQGMSANGAGRISAAINAGTRPKEDERNRLILPGIEIVEKLKPSWFILENVRRMENTVITNEVGHAENILDLLARRLQPLGYEIRSTVIDFKDLGVPHSRERLITIGTRVGSVIEMIPEGAIFSKNPTILHPALTHGKDREYAHVTLRQVIGKMNPIEAKEGSSVDPNDPYHHVPVWNDDHMMWMKHTKEGETAFNNSTCINEQCKHQTEDMSITECPECGSSLPRPQKTVFGWRCSTCRSINEIGVRICECGKKRSADEKAGEQRRLIRGFKTSYRRLNWDKPASTITMNSGVISSDMKGHPDQNRVLSVREILKLSSLENYGDVSYPWSEKYIFESKREDGSLFFDGKFSPNLVRRVIGESIPPLAMMQIVQRLKELDPRVPTQ